MMHALIEQKCFNFKRWRWRETTVQQMNISDMCFSSSSCILWHEVLIEFTCGLDPQTCMCPPKFDLTMYSLHLQTFAWGQCRRRRWHVPRILHHNSRFVRIQCWYLELDLHSFRSQSIDHSLRVFHEISLNVGRYESNNVVCIPNVILFNSQLSVSCSSNSLYKTVLIAQSFVEKPL